MLYSEMVFEAIGEHIWLKRIENSAFQMAVTYCLWNGNCNGKGWHRNIIIRTVDISLTDIEIILLLSY